MRGGFLLGTIVGAAAVSLILSRRNNNMNIARMGTMVTNAIGDGFKMMTNTNKTANAAGAGTSQAARAGQSDNQAAGNSANQQQLKNMINQDSKVQKEVNEILTQNTH